MNPNESLKKKKKRTPDTPAEFVQFNIDEIDKGIKYHLGQVKSLRRARKMFADILDKIKTKTQARS